MGALAVEAAMLRIAFIVLACAAIVGGGLALGLLGPGGAAPPDRRGRTARLPSRGAGLAHGALGATGFLVLLVALQEGAPAGTGAAGFGRIAAWLFGAALLFGLAILGLAHRRRGRTAILVAAHATLAISGIVVLMARVFLG
ncbi:MAG: hypothetical protein KGK10_09285 [Rhodospirillales bacterium]|nr:hypothetical protein [Rhodospirillales bacterium]